jgi:signal transduction histidine kinase
MLQRSTDSMQLLLEDLLDISAIEMGMLQLHKVTYNLTDHVNDRIQLFSEQANNKSLLFITDMPETAMLEADPSRINQVLDNLMSNAIKYSEEKNEIIIALIKTSDSIRFSITNTGPGIPKEEQAKLFKPFQCLSSKTTAGESSHGLGLSICMRIINGHDGSLHYEDSKPKGSHFYFDLPK